MKKSRMLGLIVFISAISLTACSGNGEGRAQDAEKSATQAEYNTKYNFMTKLLDNSDVRLEDFRGKVVIVDLWDTWCPPCRMEIPHFIELYSVYKDAGFIMLGLAFGQEGMPAVLSFIQEYGINYLNGLVNEDVIAKLGQPQGIPTTFVFDQNGNIYKKYVGYREKSVFEADIKSLLKL
ncbi:TlpA family protein disulfide reductase [candidate division KSB1 bacterium]|nr:TlpA family protein disulfide reductase [candidate division KSB1 bacterium]